MSTSKSLSNHLKVLEERHRALDEKIIILEDDYTSNEIVNPLKLKKLELKREIEELKIQIKEKQNESK